MMMATTNLRKKYTIKQNEYSNKTPSKYGDLDFTQVFQRANIIFFALAIVSFIITMFAAGGDIENMGFGGVIFTVFVIPLIITIAIVYSVVHSSKLQALEDNKNQFTARKKDFLQEQTIARSSGYDQAVRIQKLRQQRAAEAMRIISDAMLQSAAQEKEHDWAIAGGIASGVAGGFAGVAAAANTMAENQKIQARNEANRAAVQQQAKMFNDMALQLEMQTFAQKAKEQGAYIANLPSEMLQKLQLNCTVQSANFSSRCANATISFQGSYPVISGSLRIKLYDGTRFVGCGYAFLPENGAESKGGESVRCLLEKEVRQITNVVVEPVNLWELQPSENMDEAKRAELIATHQKEIETIDTEYQQEFDSSSLLNWE